MFMRMWMNLASQNMRSVFMRSSACSNKCMSHKLTHWLVRIYLFLTSHIGLLHFVMGRPVSPSASHFDFPPCLSSSCTLSCNPSCCPAISSWASPSSYLPPLAHLTSYWWYPHLPSVTRGDTISVVSFWGRLSCFRCWLLSRCLHS